MKARCSEFGVPLFANPSSVTMASLPTERMGVTHERVGLPLISTVHAPHWPRPHPKRGPLSARSLRSTYSSGVFPSHFTVARLPFTLSWNVPGICFPPVVIQRGDQLSLFLATTARR